MKEEILLLVKELKERIHQVFGEFEKIEERNEVLQQEILSLKNKVQFLEQEKGLLGKKYENLKLAKTFEADNEDKLAARKKINKLMREIDKCVALLND